MISSLQTRIESMTKQLATFGSENSIYIYIYINVKYRSIKESNHPVTNSSAKHKIK